MTIELVIFTGLQASGKTTFYHQRLSTHVHVSKDLWPNYREPERRQRQWIDHAMRDRKDAVVDNTNPSVDDRAPLIAIGRSWNATLTCYRFASTFDESFKRNALRDEKERVPDVGLRACASRLVAPTFAEGFDRIFEVRLAETGFTVTEISQ